MNPLLRFHSKTQQVDSDITQQYKGHSLLRLHGNAFSIRIVDGNIVRERAKMLRYTYIAHARQVGDPHV
jgi:hypothetical protein